MKHLFKTGLTPELLMVVLGFFLVPQVSQAEIVLVNPIDSGSITTTHLGGDTITLVETGESAFVQISGGYYAGHIGYDPDLEVFSSGLDLDPVDGSDHRSYLVSGVATYGAVAGLNYASMDLDVDGIYETVVEFNFGDSITDTSDDLITRYAYDDTGAYLRVSDAFSIPEPDTVIIEQVQITGQADYGTGQGQTFLLPAGERVTAIQLHIGSVGSGGGSIFIRLWEVTGSPGSYSGRASAQPVATGTLNKSDVSGTPNWFTIILEQSYTNNAPDSVYMVFEIELLTSGSEGWNNYSYSNQEPYDGGHSVYWTGSQYAIRDGQDLTFRILNSAPTEGPEIAVPEISFENITWHATYNARTVVSLRETDEDYFYYLHASDSLSDPQSEWEIIDGAPGRSGREIYFNEYYISAPEKRFFRISRELIE